MSDAATSHTVEDNGRTNERPEETAPSVELFDEMTSLEALEEALTQVARNKGAPGVDRQTVEAVLAHQARILPTLSQALRSGNYRPGDIRRVWIPKSSGGQRGLGIPNVIDRVVQQAALRVLEPVFEPTFHPSSHGFRFERSCHTAIAQASRYVTEEQRRHVLDIDVKSFFDEVHHQRLLARIGQRVPDRRLLRLIGRMLKAKVVLPNGVRIPVEQGVPQGGPLSPLLSNIVLDELDWELERRGHCFVRYADDCNVYVRSERAGTRAMASIRKFIEERLRLKVNEAKSAIARPWERHFLGFRVGGTQKGRAVTKLSARSEGRLKERINELTRRNIGQSMARTIEALNRYLRGWTAYFHPCTQDVLDTLATFDKHIRRRLRAIIVRQKKRPRNLYRHLVKCGISRRSAAKAAFSGRGIWWMSRSGAKHHAYPNRRFEAKGLASLVRLWERYHPRVASGPA